MLRATFELLCDTQRHMVSGSNSKTSELLISSVFFSVNFLA